MLSSVCTKSPTSDEIFHLVGGYSYWQRHDYRMQPENGVLPQRWGALPLLAMGLNFPPRETPGWQTSDMLKAGQRFLYHEENDADRIVLAARMAMALLTLGTGLVVFLWSRRLFGDLGGLISLALFAFCPTALANGALVTSDMASALAFLTALALAWQLMNRVTLSRTGLTGAALGCLFAAKASGVLILPMLAFLALLRLTWRRPLSLELRKRRRLITGRVPQLCCIVATLVCAGAIAWVTLWAFYGFRYRAFAQPPAPGEVFAEGLTIDSMTSDDAPGRAIRCFRDHRLFPEAYLHGFAFVLKHASGRVSFLHGEYSTEGRAAFFPYCAAVKTPLPIACIILLALCSLGADRFRGRRLPARQLIARLRSSRRAYASAPLWTFLVVYWAVAVGGDLNIGHRHILPVYPFTYILCGAAALWLSHSASRWWTRALWACLILLGLEMVLTWPHYLAYFNQIAGGPSQGYLHLVDSSLDWGQDAPGLKQWIAQEKQRAPQARIHVAFFGTAELDHYGIEAVRLLSGPGLEERETRPWTGGVYCVSATLLRGILTTAPGPWTPEHEKVYGHVIPKLRPTSQEIAENGVSAELPPDEVRRLNNELADYEQLRFARLRAYLLTRRPDDHIGYSILVFRLTEDDLKKALDAPLSTWEQP
ncbi:MAG: hypothetical protein HN742_24755 [Lentisphaerae bacterium]|jgi:4-amino-4-deoxy-L-arabinose transferase-like glycosyltransferase|nr:hypothetical protein [Lentisphaerota bacterium]MBT4823395.1 hypothetical protein [Lentisphaerota bacterium]MBT5606245.1 hypothetical protein [Lentisphaerota bacterium]MBT7054072.1 hypothetical protein [Lentisphaerota bacterium]MBT7845111.1 hypothetical protein [Lentisphaerota bacterium]